MAEYKGARITMLRVLASGKMTDKFEVEINKQHTGLFDTLEEATSYIDKKTQK